MNTTAPGPEAFRILSDLQWLPAMISQSVYVGAQDLLTLLDRITEVLEQADYEADCALTPRLPLQEFGANSRVTASLTRLPRFSEG